MKLDTENPEADKAISPGMAAFRDDLNGVTARRWFGIRRALDMTSDEILEDPVACMVVVAHERGRGNAGRDEWDKYLNLNMAELTDMLGLNKDEAAEVVATKSE